MAKIGVVTVLALMSFGGFATTSLAQETADLSVTAVLCDDPNDPGTCTAFDQLTFSVAYDGAAGTSLNTDETPRVLDYPAESLPATITVTYVGGAPIQFVHIVSDSEFVVDLSEVGQTASVEFVFAANEIEPPPSGGGDGGVTDLPDTGMGASIEASQNNLISLALFALLILAALPARSRRFQRR